MTQSVAVRANWGLQARIVPQYSSFLEDCSHTLPRAKALSAYSSANTLPSHEGEKKGYKALEKVAAEIGSKSIGAGTGSTCKPFSHPTPPSWKVGGLRAKSRSQKFVALIETIAPVCVEKFTDYPQLGRFTLRDEGKTIAIEKITKLVQNDTIAGVDEGVAKLSVVLGTGCTIIQHVLLGDLRPLRAYDPTSQQTADAKSPQCWIRD
ncbi:hypothetical protein FA13DRAFT_1841240 [Coprinellus micaceus]|uniref:GTP-eEF1A C-terminal domain-containing protein n=1 Tax=Coprinellus micaceus TaxID=71717 RepID=A0A4Y7SE02_COPMI|nr:hypothetical protein FA13DRAFT_1841240 [Coprinellus micaceus]